jgi:hypothetical protein
MTDISTLPAIVLGEPEFRLSDFLDLTRPVDYFVLHDAHVRACEAFCGPQFRAAVCALGEKEAAFWERTLEANYSNIQAGKEKPPTGYLGVSVPPAKEQPTEARPFLWWLRDSIWR